MNPVILLIPGIRAFRPFLPAKDFETSLRFYEAIGFTLINSGIRSLNLASDHTLFCSRVTMSKNGRRTR